MTSNNTGTRQPQHDLTAELNFLSRKNVPAPTTTATPTCSEVPLLPEEA